MRRSLRSKIVIKRGVLSYARTLHDESVARSPPLNRTLTRMRGTNILNTNH